MEWPFTDPPNSAVFTSKRVAQKQAVVVRVIRDDEGDWQALDAAPRGEEDAALVALQSLLELHPDVRAAVELLDSHGWGWQAVRDTEGAWTAQPYSASA